MRDSGPRNRASQPLQALAIRYKSPQVVATGLESPIAGPGSGEAAWLSPAEFAALARVPERTVSWLCQRRRLPGSHRVGRRWRIDLAEFRRLTAAATPPPVPQEAPDGPVRFEDVLASVVGRR